MKYLLSTLTNSFIFVKYDKPVFNNKGEMAQYPRALRRIRVAGGANRPNMRGFGEQSADNEGVPMWTPKGVCSPVQESDLQWLMRDQQFRLFVEGGHIKVVDSDLNSSQRDINRAVSDMTARDAQALLLPNDPRLTTSPIKTDEDSFDENLIGAGADELSNLLSE